MYINECTGSGEDERKILNELATEAAKMYIEDRATTTIRRRFVNVYKPHINIVRFRGPQRVKAVEIPMNRS